MPATLCSRRRFGAQCYLIINGSIIVSKCLESGLDQTLATLNSGELLGQIALIDRKPRSATRKAGPQGASLVLLGSDTFERLYLHKIPCLQSFRSHCFRFSCLRGANQQLSKAKSASNDQLRHSLFKAAWLLLAPTRKMS